MGFEVEVTDEFARWYSSLGDDAKDAVDARVDLLSERGPMLKRPVVGEITGSMFDPQMKELRVSVGRSLLRVLFIFDPRRTAILLLGGDKSGDWNAWYQRAIQEAEELYQVYLEELREEGLL